MEDGYKTYFHQETHSCFAFCCSTLGDGLVERVCSEDNMLRH